MTPTFDADFRARFRDLVLWRRVEGSRIQAWSKYGREPGSTHLGLPLVLLLCLCLSRI